MTERLRVEVVVQHLRRAVPGGIGTYTRGLLGGLKSLGGEVEPTLYSGRPPARQRAHDPVAQLASELGFGWHRSRLPGPLLTRAWDRGLVRAPGGEPVVHAVSRPRRRSGARRVLVVTVHDLAWRHVPAAFPLRGLRWHEAALRRALARGAGFAVPSELVAGELVSAGARPEAVRIVGEGSDHLPAPDEEATEEVLARLDVRGPFVLSVSTLEPRKNLARLVEAYALARTRFAEPWPLVVVGPTGWGQVVQATEVPGVVLAGQVPDGVLSGLYARARVLVYVPLAEGFGLPPLEAMAAGIPVVSSPVPSVGDAALLVDPTDVEAIAAGLADAAMDGSGRERLVGAGRAQASRTTWAEVARRHVELWRSSVA